MSADLERVVRIVFQGDNETKRAFKEIGSSLDSMESGIRSVTGPMADAADAALKAQTALAALATGGIALVVQQAGSWSDQFNEISTLIDATGADLDDFKRQVLEYGTESSFAFEDVNTAIYEAISRYTEYGDAISFVSEAERLAIGGKAQLKEATVLMASAMGAYGEEADQAGRYSDVFFSIVKEGGTTLPQVADSLARVTSLAAPMGVEIEQLGAALALLTAQGMPTSEAMTSLTGILTAVIKPSEKAKQAAEDLGVEFDTAALEAKGLDKFLRDIYESADGNVEELGLLFGEVRGLSGVLAAFGKDGGDAFEEKLRSMENAAGSSREAYDKMADNVGLANQRLINSMKGTLIQAGLPILDEYGSAVNALSGIFDGLRVGIDAGVFDPLYEHFENVINRIAQFVEDVGNALPEALDQVEWDTLLDGLKNLDESLGGLFQALFQDLDMTKPEDLAQIIQTMVDGLGNLANLSSGIVKEWRPLVETLGQMITQFGKLDSELAESAGQMLGTAQKAEFLFNQFGFLKGGVMLMAAEMSASSEDASSLGLALNAMLNPSKMAMEASEKMASELGLTSTAMQDTAQATGEVEKKSGGLLDIFQRMPGPVGELARAIGFLGSDAHAAELDLARLGEGIEILPEEKDVKVHAGVDQDDDLPPFVDMWNDMAEDNERFATFGVNIEGGGVEELSEMQEFVRELDDMELSPSVEFDVRMDKAKELLQELEVDIEDLTQDQILMVLAQKDPESFEKLFGELEDLQDLTVEVEVESDEVKIARIEEQFETLREAARLKVELDIAEVEASAQKVSAAFESIGEGLQSSASLLSDTMDKLGDQDLGLQDRLRVQEVLREELKMRQQMVDTQSELAQAEIDWMNARTQAMSRGQAMIQVDGGNLAPHLESIMWEILNEIKIRASEEGQAMLLGM